jgi:membrane protease YdiL (CAAX protease family)
MQEELGWRGFALPRLQERHSPLVASAILGVLVAIWHTPLVFLGMLPAFALFGTFAFTIVFGWLFNNTKGSVLMTLIAHAADGLVLTGNLGLNALDSERHIRSLVATWCVTALVIVLLYGPTLTRRPNAHAPTR